MYDKIKDHLSVKYGGNIKPQVKVKSTNQTHSLAHIKSIPSRFRHSKHTEPIHYQAQVIKIIRPYRVYRQQQDGSIHYEIRCNICGAICKNILNLSSMPNSHYYLGCPVHALKPKYKQLFDVVWPKLQWFLDTTAISEKFIVKL